MAIFIAWIIFIRSEQKSLESHNKLCENKDFGGELMSSEDTKMLELNQYQKPDKKISIIFTDIESLIKKNGLMWKIILKNNL